MTKGDLLPIQDLLGYALGAPDEAERVRLVQSAYWSLCAVINGNATATWNAYSRDVAAYRLTGR